MNFSKRLEIARRAEIRLTELDLELAGQNPDCKGVQVARNGLGYVTALDQLGFLRQNSVKSKDKQ